MVILRGFETLGGLMVKKFKNGMFFEVRKQIKIASTYLTFVIITITFNRHEIHITPLEYGRHKQPGKICQ
jgi:phosphate starvation-inducible membrane PsiE